MNLMISFILSYIGVIIVFFVLFNFLTGGFLGTFIRIKMSQGKLILVEVFGLTNTYYRAGSFDGTKLRYKNRSGNRKTMVVPSRIDPILVVFRKLGQPSVSVDDEKNAFLLRSFDGVEGFDAEQFDNICTRLATLPEIQIDKKEIAILVVTVLTLFGVIFIAYKTGVLMEAIQSIKSLSGVIN